MTGDEGEAFAAGAALLAKLSPAGTPPPWESFADIAPALGHNVGLAFGTVINRPGLDLRTRELITVAILATLGGSEPQIGFHAGAALRAGASPQELVEAMTHLSVYAGIPRALNAVAAIRPAFVAAGVSGLGESPRAVAAGFLDAIAAGDVGGAAARLSPAVTWPSRPGPGPFSDPWRGPHQLDDFLASLSSRFLAVEAERSEPLPHGQIVHVPLTYVDDESSNRSTTILRFQVDSTVIDAVEFFGPVGI